MALNKQNIVSKIVLLLLVFTLFSAFVQAQTSGTFVCADNQLYGDVVPYNFSLVTNPPLQPGIHDMGDSLALAQLEAGLYSIDSIVDQYGFPSSCQCLDPNLDGRDATILDALYVEQIVDGFNHTITRCPTIVTPPLNATLCQPGAALGDVDFDGNITIIDARIAAEISVGLRAPPADLCCIDAHPNNGTGNGYVDILDGLTIAQASVGLYNLTGPGCPLLPPPQANLSITKTANVTTAMPGDLVAYTITITNSGTADALAQDLFDIMPPNMNFVSATPPPTKLNSSHVYWEINVTQNSTVFYTLILEVDPLYVASLSGDLFLNEATLQNLRDNATVTVFPPSTPPAAQPVLTVTKQDLIDPVMAGGSVDYRITVTNVGTADAENVVVTETYPPGFTYLTSTPLPTIIPDTWNLGTIPANTTTFIDVTLSVDPSIPDGTVLTNLVNVSYENSTGTVFQTTTQENTTVVNPPVQFPIISLQKTANVTMAMPGDFIQYTIEITNTGAPGDVFIQETYPAGTQYDSSSVSPDLGTDNEWTFINLSTGTTFLDIVLEVLPGANGTLDNFVVATWFNGTANQTTTANSSTPVNTSGVPPGGQPVLTVTKQDLIDPVMAGGSVDYRITVQNIGTADAENVIVTETYPPGFTYLTATPLPTIIPDTWNLGTIPSNTTVFIDVTLSVDTMIPDGTVLTNVVNTTYENSTGTVFQVNTQENTTVQNLGPAFPFVILSKTANQTSVDAGGQLQYTITINNTGAAGVVTVTEMYPAQTSFVSAVPNPDMGTNNQWTFMMGAGVVTTIDIIVDVDPLAMGVLDNVAVASFANATGNTTVSANVSTPVNTSVLVPQANLSATKVANQTSAYPGEIIEYTITLFNTGTANATGINVVDMLPVGMTFVSSVPPPTNQTMQLITWTVDVPAGNMTQIVAQVQVDQGVVPGTLLTNFVSVNNTSVMANETINVSMPPPAIPPVLSVTKTPLQTSVMRGENLTYQITLDNTGGDAFNVSVIDTLPPFTSYVSAMPPATAFNATHVEWFLPIVPGMQQTDLFLTVQVDLMAPLGPGLINSVNVTYFNGTTNITNTTNTSMTPVNTTPNAGGVPNLTITKTDTPDPVLDGDLLNYTLTITNVGNGTAIGVEVNEMSPSELTFVSSMPPEFPPGFEQWQLGNMLPGEVRTINITYQVASGVPNGTVIHNNASVEYSDGVMQYVELVTEDTTILNPPRVPTLDITKVANQTMVTAGEQIEYTISIRNTARVDATNVFVQETYPAQTTFNSSVPTPDVGTDNEWTFPLIPAFATQNITIVLDVLPNATGSLVNMVNATVNNGTTNVTTNTTTNTTIIPLPRAILTIDKTDTPDPVMSGGVLNYTITVENIGNATATNVVVAETFPANFMFVSSNPQRIPFTYTWPLGNMQPGEVRTINVTGTVAAGLVNGTILTNDVSVFYDNQIMQTFNYDQENTTVTSNISAPVPPPQILLNKTANQTLVVPGDLVLYTITVENTQNNTAQVSVFDTLDPDLIFINASPASLTPPQALSWNLTVGPFETQTINITAQVSGQVDVPVAIYNEVTANNGSVNSTSNETITTTFPPVVPPMISIEKTTMNTTAMPGDNINYTITLNNTGGTANNVVVQDTIPNGTTYVSDSASVSPTISLPVLTWTFPTIPTGITTWDVQFQVQQGAPSPIINYVNVTYNNGSMNITNMTDTSGMPINVTNSTTPTPVAPFIAVEKIPLTASVMQSGVASYLITLNNTGGDAYNVSVVDTLPLETTFNSATPTEDSFNATHVEWLLPTVPAMSTYNLTLNVNVDANATLGMGLINGVSVTYFNGTQNITNTTNTSMNPINVTNGTTPVPPSVAIEKTTMNTSAMAGDLITYTITLNNTGGAGDATVVDAIPSGTAYNSSTLAPTSTSPDLVWEFNPLASGVMSWDVTFEVLPGAVSPIVNYVNVTYNNGSMNITNMTDTSGMPINVTNSTTPIGNDTTSPIIMIHLPVDGANYNSSPIDLNITASDDSGIINIVYTVTYLNGTSVVGPVSLPGQTSPFGLLDTFNLTMNGTYTVTATAVDPSGNNATHMVTFTYNTSAPGNGTGPQTDLNPSIMISANNTMGDAALDVQITCDLTQIGDQNHTFTIDFGDGSPAVSSGSINDVTFTAAHTYYTVGNYTATCNVVDADLDAANAQLPINVTGTTVTPPSSPYANVSITKTVNQTDVMPGDEVEYTITATNTGSVDALNISVEEIYPQHLTFLSANPTPDVSDNQWYIDVPALSSSTINVTLRVNGYLQLQGLAQNNIIANYSNGTMIPTNVTNGTINVSGQDTESPIVSVINPQEGATYNETVPISFNATDNVELIYVHYRITAPNSSIVYEVTLDPNSTFVDIMDSFNMSGLPAGNYTFYVTVQDAAGNLDFAQINFMYDPTTGTTPGTTDLQPTVVITANATTIQAGDSVELTCEITQPGNPPYALFEFDFFDGTYFDLAPTSATIVTVPHTYNNVGTYPVSCTINDVDFDLAQASIRITVEGTNSSNSVPNITIDAPMNLDMFTNIDVIEFNSTFLDAEDGSSFTSLVWESDIDGILGSVEDITSTLTPGTHVISVTATDSAGAIAFDAITLEVVDVLVTPPSFTVTKVANTTMAGPGEEVEYTINVTNTGGPVDGVTIVDNYPVGLSFVSANPTPTSGNNTWVYNSTGGDSYVISVILSVDLNVTPGTPLLNSVVVNNGSTNTTGNTSINVTDNLGIVEGYVNDSANYIFNATVEATRNGFTFTTYTDANGYYMFNIPEGPYNMTASKNGYMNATNSTTVVYNSTVQQNFTLTPLATSGAFAGRVFNATSFDLIEGATVNVYDFTTGQLVQQALTDANGEYVVYGLPFTGEYSINATKPPQFNTVVFSPTPPLTFAAPGMISGGNDIGLTA